MFMIYLPDVILQYLGNRVGMLGIFSRNDSQVGDLISRVHSQILQGMSIVLRNLGGLLVVRHDGQTNGKRTREMVEREKLGRRERIKQLGTGLLETALMGET